MITKERLEELIQQEATIWVLSEDKDYFRLFLDNSITEENDNYITNGYICVNYNNLYETKEETEFVAKNHDTRIEKFEPPFKLDLFDTFEFVSKHYCYVSIIHSDKDYHIFDQNDCVDDHFKTYQEAVDYAHKLFKGEE